MSDEVGMVEAPVEEAQALKKASDEQVGGDHYKSFVIQPGVFAEVNKLTFFEGDVVKRLCRHSRGGKGIEDLKKCIHEIKLIAETQYGEYL